MQMPTLPLQSLALPIIGFGTYLISDEDCEAIIQTAVANGYRHFDTAEGYANESGIGRALSTVLDNGQLSRDELVITTKLWPGNPQWGQAGKEFQQVIEACEHSLEKLQLEYVDLYLIHAPFAKEQRLEQWQALLELQASGKVKEIGVCNYNPSHLEEIRLAGLALPTLNQIEINPWSRKAEVREYMAKQGISAIAYSSLAPLSTWRVEPDQVSSKTESLARERAADNALFSAIAKQHGVSEAQVLLRWAIQQNIAVIPKSIHPERMQQNLDLLTFTLSEAEMAALDKLDKGAGIAWQTGDPSNFI